MTRTQPRPLRQAFSALRLVRPHHWIKNAVVASPLICAPEISAQGLVLLTCTIAAFCLAASAGYVLNDLRDIEFDRAHKYNAGRPLAAGEVSTRTAWFILSAFALCAALMSMQVNPKVFGALVCFLVLSIAYSTWLRRCRVFDAMAVGGLFALRMIGGMFSLGLFRWELGLGVACGAMSLTFIKRLAFLETDASVAVGASRRRGYSFADSRTLLGAALGFAGLAATTLILSDDAFPPNRRLAAYLVIVSTTACLMMLTCDAEKKRIRGDPVRFALSDFRYQAISVCTISMFIAALVLKLDP